MTRRLPWCLVLAAACAPAVPELPASTGAIDAPGDGSDDPGFTLDPVEIPADLTPPSVVIKRPGSGSVIDSATLVIGGSAEDDVGLATVLVKVGNNAFVPASTGDNFRSWELVAATPLGEFVVVARALDAAGRSSTDEIQLRRPVGDDDEDPTLTVDAPADGAEVDVQTVLVRGRTSDDSGVVAVEVKVVENGDTWALAETADNFATFALATALISGRTNTVVVRATDAAGRTTRESLELTSRLAEDTEPPVVELSAPLPSAVVGGTSVLVTGTASDNRGVAAVHVRVGEGPYELAEGAPATFSLRVNVPSGASTISVRALDINGLATRVEREVTSTYASGFGDPEMHVLRPTLGPSHEDLLMALDADGVRAVMPLSVRQNLIVMHLDVHNLMVNSLDHIKSQCGTGWWSEDTPLSCPAEWSQREKNMYRLLTMTPDNVNVGGTSILGLEELAGNLSSLGLIDEFSEILAATMGIGVYEEFIPTEFSATSLIDHVVATHPAAIDGKLPVSLEDALNDMTTLAPRFGAQGGHPGFLDATFGTYSKMLLDDFKMILKARSNLAWHDGVDLGLGKEYMAIVDGDDVVEFDFLDPDRFEVVGIAASPVTDLMFEVKEHDGWLSTGNSRFPLPYGNGGMWTAEEWTLERVVADAAYRRYQDHRAGCTLCEGGDDGALLYEALGVDESEVVVGNQGYDKDGVFGGPDGEPEHFDWLDPNPPGWMRIWTLFGLGDPPAPQYVWDILSEVAQRRIQDGGVAEGDGDIAFPLRNIPVGITAAQIREAMRPQLEAQREELSDELLGDYHLNNGAVDFFLATGADGEHYLYFADESDPRPEPGYDYKHPGFFRDAAMGDRASTTSSLGSGDTVHQKVRVSDEGGEVYYVEDDDDLQYRVEMLARDGDAVRMLVRRKL